MIERFASLYATYLFPTIVFTLVAWSAWQALRDRMRGAK